VLVIAPKRVALILGLIVAGLSLGHVFTQCVKYLYDHDVQLGFERLLNLNNEGNIPSWYSSLSLLLSSGLLAAIGLEKRAQRAPFATHWMILAGIFVYLSLDEAAEIHEMGMDLLASFHLTGHLYYSWVILGGLFVTIVGISYLRFLGHLPVTTMRLFLVSGSLYVGGAIGIEMIGAHWDFLHGQESLTYALLVALEETMEMSGIAVFIHTLCSYIEQESHEIRLIFDSHPPALSIRSSEAAHLKKLA
jgi:hypothetical protein